MKSLILILTGVGIGLLIAPGKGSETRQKVQDWLDDCFDNAKDAARDVAGRAKSEFSNLQNDSKDMAAGM